jgi:hypothetical protein
MWNSASDNAGPPLASAPRTRGPAVGSAKPAAVRTAGGFERVGLVVQEVAHLASELDEGRREDDETTTRELVQRARNFAGPKCVANRRRDLSGSVELRVELTARIVDRSRLRVEPHPSARVSHMCAERDNFAKSKRCFLCEQTRTFFAARSLASASRCVQDPRASSTNSLSLVPARVSRRDQRPGR